MSAIKISNVSSNAFQAWRINEASSGTVNDLPLADTPGQNEIDSFAETSWAGWNWIPLLFAGDTVNVFGYSGAQQNSATPLATCATKIVTESGTPYILICPQMLWFGTNPNQLRMSGTLVHDDPTTDGDKEFDLITNNLFILFQTTGTTVYFDSMAPIHNEVEQFMHQVIGLTEWNPSTVRLEDSSQPNNRAIEIAAIATRNGVPFTALSLNKQAIKLTVDHSEPQDILSSVSTAIDSQTFDQLLPSKLVTAKRRTPVTAEEVSKKFGIGLETAEKTLKVTMQ